MFALKRPVEMGKLIEGATHSCKTLKDSLDDGEKVFKQINT